MLKKNTKNWTIEDFKKFYAGKSPDFYGRTIGDILSYDKKRLESEHNYIQQLFPTDEESSYYSEAPVFSKSELEGILLYDETIRNNVCRAYELMVDFWDLRKDGCPRWFSDRNHNCLRVTRVLKSLNLLGCHELADEFYHLLMKKVELYGKNVRVATRYWINASKYTGACVSTNEEKELFSREFENRCDSLLYIISLCLGLVLFLGSIELNIIRIACINPVATLCVAYIDFFNRNSFKHNPVFVVMLCIARLIWVMMAFTTFCLLTGTLNGALLLASFTYVVLVLFLSVSQWLKHILRRTRIGK